jgi:hypothetical protein
MADGMNRDMERADGRREKKSEEAMGWMTGFELHQTHRHINKIQYLARQIRAQPGKQSATLQPVATKILTIQTHRRLMKISHEPAACARVRDGTMRRL